MNFENTKWYNQPTLIYKDDKYSTDGLLRVSIVASTEDQRTFNQPTLSISISNQYSKNYSLNIQHAEDLLDSFLTVLKQLNGDEIVVEKNYKRDSRIFFQFAMSSSTGDRVVIIQIFSSESDLVKIIIPLKPTFQSFLRRLKFFVENYDTICLNLLTQSLNSEYKEIVMQLPSLIKNISGQLIPEFSSKESISDCGAVEAPQVARTEEDINELDKFLGVDMENIVIDEINEGKIEPKENIVEITSKLITDVLNGDLRNLENKLTSFGLSKTPVVDLALDLEISLGFDLFGDINSEDKKSLVYISTLLYNYFSKDYTLNMTPLPQKIPPLKFVSKSKDSHIELAKDVLMIMSFVRAMRRRLESKVDDAYENKSMFYTLVRLFMDPFCYSYLTTLSRSDLISSVKNRYDYFNKNGFFDYYNTFLTDHNCSKIETMDVMSLVEETADTLLSTKPINVLHELLYNNGSLKLPTKNILKLEQIINEFIPLEIAEKLGSNLKDKDILKKLVEGNNISDEILNTYIGKKEAKVITKKVTPLQRLVEKFKQDIPETYRNEVLDFVKNLEYGTFDFKKSPWPMEEFDDRIVKAFYIWDPQADEKMKTNFEYFASMVEDDPITKESILISTKIESSEGWNAVTNFIV